MSSVWHGGTGSHADTAEGLVATIMALAVRQPTAPAVSAADGALTYADLEEQAARLAGHIEAVAPPGSVVALCLQRSAALVVGVLAVLKARCAFLALDPTDPADRLRFMLEDSGAALVLMSRGAADRVGVTRVTAEVGDLLLARLDAAAPYDERLAYVAYTSGSTGRPKGVMVEHQGLANLISWHQQAFRLTSADHCAQVANPAFDAFTWEVLPTLVCGASLHVVPEDIKPHPARLRDWLVDHGITVTFVPTPLAEALLELEWPATTALRYLLTGGDRLHQPPPLGLPFAVVNNYGVTEGTVVSTSGVVQPTGPSKQPHIGKPIDGVLVDVVDTDMRPVRRGEPGELLIGGPSVARGYVGAAALTEDRFVVDTGNPPTRWYRTGDVVRRRADGTLEFLHRVDDQVQVRGHRIEPSEVVKALDAHPDVAHSEVVVSGEGRDRTLVAYVRGTATSEPRPEELRDWLAARLPSYMIPTRFLSLAALPSTKNGKVNRHELHELVADRPVAGGLPTDEVEQTVARIVAKLLGVPSVSVHDNLFLVGGHSLLVAQLVVQLADRFGVELTLRDVFERPSVAEISTEVQRLLPPAAVAF